MKEFVLGFIDCAAVSFWVRFSRIIRSIINFCYSQICVTSSLLNFFTGLLGFEYKVLNR